MSHLPLIESLRSKVVRLAERNAALQKECGKLSEQRTKLQREKAELNERIAYLEERLKSLELKQGFGTDEAAQRRARSHVNRLIKEVDRCIAMINK